MKRIFILLLSVFLFSCEKDVLTIEEPVVDVSSKFSMPREVIFKKPLIVNGIHAETIKLVKLNNDYHLIVAYADLFGTSYDYFRSFLVDTITGQLIENTETILGEYRQVGFPKSPFFYEDLNNDGIKDLFAVDHGKETQSLMVNGQFPGFVNHLFYGTADGKFKTGHVQSLTDVLRFHHNSSVNDIDKDGDKDLLLQAFSNTNEMVLFKNNNGLTRSLTISPNNSTGAVLMDDIDMDGKTDIVSAPYIDKTSKGTYILKINVTDNNYTTTKISGVSPFGEAFGCFKILSLNNKQQNKKNIFYFVEDGKGNQEIFRSNGDKIENVQTIQKTYKSNNMRDYMVMDFNFDGFDDILLITNRGENLNQKVWINKGDNTFENPNWNLELNMNGFFIPISTEPSKGRINLLYYSDELTPRSILVSVYTKK